MKHLTAEAHSHCLICDAELLEAHEDYLIEKVVRNYRQFHLQDTILEYAVCMRCALRQRKRISAESLQAVEAYLAPHVAKLATSSLEYCLVTNEPLAELEEYQLMAYCRGSTLHPDMPKPFALGLNAMLEIGENLSASTRQEMDGFLGEHFGLPPELQKDLPARPILF
ncbi:MAG: hypothetical protein HC842_09150 [Cytophagales bacterium]|nr:hypothetical protein [Cytophagales bacterium]